MSEETKRLREIYEGPLEIRARKDVVEIADLRAALKKVEQELADHEQVITSHNTLVRDLDVILNGFHGSATQASLCDLVGKIAKMKESNDEALAELAALREQEPVDAVALCDMDDGSDKRYGPVLVATRNCVKPMYTAAGAVRSIPKGVRRKLLDELGAEWEGADGNEWDDAVVTMVENYLAAGAAPEQGEIVVTKTPDGQIVAVTRQDEEGRILKVIAESTPKGLFIDMINSHEGLADELAVLDAGAALAITEEQTAAIKIVLAHYEGDARIEPLRMLLEADAAPVPDGWKPDMAHVANEWADAATNGPQYVRNIQDGICTFEEALSGMARDIAHCREVRAAMLSASPKEPS